MKQIIGKQEVKIPDGIKASVKKRIVTVTGPRGVLKRSFKHLSLNMYMTKEGKLRVEKWFGSKKELAAVRTVCSHIENMIKGVTKVGLFSSVLVPESTSPQSNSLILNFFLQGFLYKMRAVYAHFPINCVTSENNTVLEVRNFLGEKFIRRVKMAKGVTVVNSTKQKDELIIEGNSIEDVSRSGMTYQTSYYLLAKLDFCVNLLGLTA